MKRKDLKNPNSSKMPYRRMLGIALAVALVFAAMPAGRAPTTGFPQDYAIPAAVSSGAAELYYKYLSMGASAVSEETITIYYPSADFSSVGAVVSVLALEEGESVFEAAVQEILRRAKSILFENGRYINVYLRSFSRTDSIVSVNLSKETDQLSEQELFTLAYCITNTLTEFSEISYVNLLIGDMAAVRQGLPFGALSYFTDSVQVADWQFGNKVSTILNSSESALAFMAAVTVYYGAASAPLILGEIREISCYGNTERMIPPIINEIIKGPRNTNKMLRLFPLDAYLSNFSISATESGGQSIHLDIGGAVSSYFARNKIEPTIAVSSIALTLFDCYPNLESVSVYFTDGLQSIYSGLTRRSCEQLLGSSLRLFYPLLDTALILAVDRIVPSYVLPVPGTVLSEIFSVPPSTEAGEVGSMMPPGSNSSDVIATVNIGSMTIINVSWNFIESVRAMDAQSEKTALYCIVNTLCVNEGTKSVLFLTEGEICDNIPGRINLSEPLYYNPGIVSK